MPSTVEEEIRATLALYALVHDREDIDRFAELFTEDARFISRGIVHAGRAAVKAFMAEVYASRPPDKRMKHCYMNSYIEVQGDSANVTSDFIAWEAFGYGPWTINYVGQMVDRLVRRDGRWVFAERRVHPS
jgi:uncharacterized protein (TIGR02246 family)